MALFQSLKMTEFSVITGSMVEVDITSNITCFTSQKKFDKAPNNLILVLGNV